MAQLHGLDDAGHNHGGTQTRSQAQEKHLAALVAPEGLHGGIIDDLHRAPECFITAAYEAILNRTPDSSEIAFWLGVYDSNS
jgi:hypothetical protein